MADILYTGSKKKYVVSIQGLDYLYLSDDDVDFTVEFYCNGKYSQGVCTKTKSECTFVYDEGESSSNTFHVICDTSSLPTGSLVCMVTISYPDIDTTGGTLKDIVKLDSDAITIANF